MHHIRNLITYAVLAVAMLAGLSPVGASPKATSPSVTTLTTGIAGANGSAMGPDGALYVTESDTGQILRIDPATGAASVYASGLPTRIAPIGGPMDLVFHGKTAYVLVSLVGEFFGSPDPTGIYRMDGPDEWTVIADLGAWSQANPPGADIHYFITTGVHYSIDTYRGGFIVAEAHHNKVVHVTRDGDITEVEAFGNTVPTGLETWGEDILVAMAGPQPHLPEDGQILLIEPSIKDDDDDDESDDDDDSESDDRKSDDESDDDEEFKLIAAGGPLLVDVERGRGDSLYGLAQGFFTPGQPDGAPAELGTGELLLSDGEGGFTTVIGGLDQPLSMEIVGTTAYIVGFQGTVVRVDDITVK